MAKETFANAQLVTTQSRLLTTLCQKPFENIMGKGENAGNQHFLLFPQCFLSLETHLLSANVFNLDWSKILSLGTGLNLYHTIPDFNDSEEAS